MTRAQVKELQTNINERLHARGRATVRIDGKLGPKTKQAVHVLKYLLGFPERSLNTGPSPWFRTLVAHPGLRPPTYLARARSRRDYLRGEKRQGSVATAGVGDFGIDWAWGSPSIPALKKAGVKFACRYLSHDQGKNLSFVEAKRLSTAGIAIAVVWETTANRALAGYKAGQTDAKYAQAQAVECGMPLGRPIYFAVDFDATPAQQDAINQYLKGAGSVIGPPRVGVYGGHHVVKRCLDAGTAKWGWQTYAWSGGLLDSRAHIFQYSNGHTLAGVSCDYDRALKSDFGEWKV